MPSGTVDRRLASFCTSRLRAVRMQAKSDRNYPVLPYLKKKKKREVTVVWAWAGKRETADPELAGGLAHRWERAGDVDRRPGRPLCRACR